ncbi:helix-turn-helix transcriptional regulator [Bacillus sp. JJ722]|uniref:helix-turn-helix transcriptional regulator n=1 Tax=Bacillus sp. JJ722 TaxID=3122973 RepID=UPI002FFF96E4
MIITLKQARLIRGLTQKELAKNIGVHVQTYRKMETHPNDVTIGEAKKICSILDVDYNSIFFGGESTLGRVEGM